MYLRVGKKVYIHNCFKTKRLKYSVASNIDCICLELTDDKKRLEAIFTHKLSSNGNCNFFFFYKPLSHRNLNFLFVQIVRVEN